MSLRSVKRAVRQHVNCVVHSYGQVRQFFLTTPCRSLKRELLVVADGAGNTIVVSTYWVRMYDGRAARRLKERVDTFGTGNVSPLGGALLQIADVRFSGKYYGSRRAGSLVVIAESAPLTGRAEDAVLDGVAEVAALFPPP